jgi:hypothetical protein
MRAPDPSFFATNTMSDIFLRSIFQPIIDDDPVRLSPDQRMRKLKSVIAAAIARKLHTDPAALGRVHRGLRLKPFEIEWAMSQQTTFFTLGRLVQIALALGCDVSVSAR